MVLLGRFGGIFIFLGRLAFFGAGAARLFIFSAILCILHTHGREHRGGEVVECVLSFFQPVEQSIEFGELGVIGGEVGGEGVNRGLKVSQGEILAEV